MTVETRDTTEQNELDEQLIPRRSWWYYAAYRFSRNRFSVVGLVLVALFTIVALLSPVIAPYPQWEPHFADTWQFPSAKYWLGTDSLGRDVLSRIIAGARTSMTVALAVQSVNFLIGITLGASAGFFGGLADLVIMRVVDIIFSMPVLLLSILIMAALGSGMINLIMAMCITGWVGMAQLTRAQVLYLREQDYVLAARAIGVRGWRIVARHLLPNAFAPIIVSLTLGFPRVVMGEAGLSFLGLGLSRDIPSWGRMIAEGNENIIFYWHLALFPALALALMIFGFAFLGDGLRDALDPRTR